MGLRILLPDSFGNQHGKKENPSDNALGAENQQERSVTWLLLSDEASGSTQTMERKSSEAIRRISHWLNDMVPSAWRHAGMTKVQ